MEDKKKLGMILTIVTLLLCCFPGACSIIGGIIFAQGYALQDYGWNVTGDPAAFTGFGIAGICAGSLGVLITIGAAVFWIVQARKGKEQEILEEVDVPDPLEG